MLVMGKGRRSVGNPCHIRKTQEVKFVCRAPPRAKTRGVSHQVHRRNRAALHFAVRLHFALIRDFFAA